MLLTSTSTSTPTRTDAALDRCLRNLYALSYAPTSSHLTRALVSCAAAAGYVLLRSSVWADQNRLGVLTVVYRDQLVGTVRWDLGNHRRLPDNYYLGSRHHHAVLDALQLVVNHAHDHGVALLLDPHPYGFYLPQYEPDVCHD